MCNVNTFEIFIKVLLSPFVILLIYIKVVLAIVDYLLLCCIGYTNMDDYNGNHESSVGKIHVCIAYKTYEAET